MYHLPLQTGTSQKTSMVGQPEPVVPPCAAPERQEEKAEEKEIQDEIGEVREENDGEK